MPPSVSFAPESDLPAVRACVDILMLTGRALRLHFPDLLDACEATGGLPPTWDEVLNVVAEILFREMYAKRITDITHARDVWRQFIATLTFRNMVPAAAEAIGKAGKKISKDAVAANAGIGTTILSMANQQAERWVRKRVLPHLPITPFSAADLVIDFDEDGQQFCASSSRLNRQIHWTLQPFEHSLYGAMVLPRVLEHEYVSHLIPPNLSLSDGVREVFLVETLEEEHRNEVSPDPRSGGADMKMAVWFRVKLEEYFVRKGRTRGAELRNFEELAVRVRRKSKSNFWKMTADILSLPDGEKESLMVDRVLKMLRASPDPLVDRLTVPWEGFEKCLSVARGIGVIP